MFIFLSIQSQNFWIHPRSHCVLLQIFYIERFNNYAVLCQNIFTQYKMGRGVRNIRGSEVAQSVQWLSLRADRPRFESQQGSYSFSLRHRVQTDDWTSCCVSKDKSGPSVELKTRLNIATSPPLPIRLKHRDNLNLKFPALLFSCFPSYRICNILSFRVLPFLVAMRP
jgi:hypothetical protein